MLWELRADPLAGNSELVVVEMKQVPGYLDFLADIMPPEVSTIACHGLLAAAGVK